MTYVLAIVTVFFTSAGVATHTSFQQFATRDACEAAGHGIAEGVLGMKGNVGREVFVHCYPAGEPRHPAASG